MEKGVNPVDNEVPGESTEPNPIVTGTVIDIADLTVYEGSSPQEKVDALILGHTVVMISKTYCPFLRDAKDLLCSQIGVTVHSLEVNSNPEGGTISHCLSSKHDHYTVPVIFLNGTFVGGCDQVKTLHYTGELPVEREYLKGIINRNQTENTNELQMAKLVPMERSTAMNPPFWFPNHVGCWVVRLTGVQVFGLSTLSAAFHYELWGRYMAVGLFVDFALHMLAGAGLSPLGMNASFVANFFKPDFRRGPPKQFASFCGVWFSFLAVLFYFLDFGGHDIIGAILMGMLAGAAGLEGFLDFCLGCVFYG